MSSPRQMVEEIVRKYRFNDPQVTSAMLKVPREEFVPPEHKDMAYSDTPISIGFGQTISQPYTVAFMTSLLRLTGNEKVLEIGTGSGYQAAILSLLADKVFSIERIEPLADKARETLERLGYENVSVKVGQGEEGWKEEAPFDAILVTAGLDEIPQELFRELKEGGVLVAPVGVEGDKKMTKYLKKRGKIKKKEYGIFHFVPFIEG